MESRPKTSITFKLDEAQQAALLRLLKAGNYRPLTVPHTRIAVVAPDCNVSLYTSGKCLVQGKGAEDFVLFTLEPEVLGTAQLGYETVLDASRMQPHIGVDESGKGDFFGPMVTAAAYVDEALYPEMEKLGVVDSKRISSDQKAARIAAELRRMLGNRFALVTVGPEAYNRLHTKMKTVNRLLSWCHARALEDLLGVVPDCPRAISDQFGNKQQVLRALMAKGRRIELEQRHKAESDIAVAAASILARDAFLTGLRKIGERVGVTIPKGASLQVRHVAEGIVRQHGPAMLATCVKLHFRTTDQVLAATGHTRADLGVAAPAPADLSGSHKSGREPDGVASAL